MSDAAPSEQASAGTTVPALAARGLTKRFPGGVVANEDVDLEVLPGEVHALLGENGAGKSTLSNMFTGLYRPDEGTIEVHGVTVDLASPRDAIDVGIGMVHQHFRLVPTFTVTENVALGRHGRFDKAEMAARIGELGARYGLDVDPDARVGQLSVGEQQRVEILKALDREADILILDEPTAVLTPQESTNLFTILRRMADEGRAIIFISHKLDEVRAVADRVTVLRDGRSTGTRELADATSRELARLMVGREIVLGSDRVSRSTPPGEDVVLAVRGLSAAGDRGNAALSGVDLELRTGEILGVCGVSGNGQRELAEVIAGMRPRTNGSIEVDGSRLDGADPRRSRRAGIAHIPEDRLHTGLSPGLSVEENLALVGYRKAPFSRGPFLDRREIRRNAQELVERHDVRTPSTTTRTANLSGGNIQKILLARETATSPRVILAASPTRGLDVGAIEAVRTALATAADEGAGILLLSEDLDEVLSLSDRIAVMFEGRIVGSFARSEADITEIGLLMGGSAGSDAENDTAEVVP